MATLYRRGGASKAGWSVFWSALVAKPPARPVAPVVASASAKNDKRALETRKKESAPAPSTGRDRMAFLPARKGADTNTGHVKPTPQPATPAASKGAVICWGGDKIS